MNTFIRQLFATFAVTLLVGCSNTAARPPSDPRLSRDEAIRIASEVATKDGRHLGDYKAAQADYDSAREAWLVFYDGRVPRPGNQFFVSVDDRTRVANVEPGR